MAQALVWYASARLLSSLVSVSENWRETGCSGLHVRDHKAAHLRGVQDSVALISASVSVSVCVCVCLSVCVCVCAKVFFCVSHVAARFRGGSQLAPRCLIRRLQLLSACRTLERRQQVNLDEIMRRTSPVCSTAFVEACSFPDGALATRASRHMVRAGCSTARDRPHAGATCLFGHPGLSPASFCCKHRLSEHPMQQQRASFAERGWQYLSTSRRVRIPDGPRPSSSSLCEFFK